MFAKIKLYIDTLKSIKKSQIFYRVGKKVGIECGIGCRVKRKSIDVMPIHTVPELDYDPIFLSRFSADEFLQDIVTFLHTTKKFRWNANWQIREESTLWNFNLHYFEYLFSIVKAYQTTKNSKYLCKSQFIIHEWILHNPQKLVGIGWSPYTIALRLTNWLAYYSAIHTELDDGFKTEFINSVYEQYKYLSRHIEKDILGNHYFENLKTLVICSLFFCDEPMLCSALKALKAECKEEILLDGMHFELSPMYHKIIMESLIRTCVALRGSAKADKELEAYLQPMLDVAWSIEEGVDRIPLFNDCGNNISKSLAAIVECCEKYFKRTPTYRSQFKESGYYIFKRKAWKLIVDAGQPGPSYIPGHAHCDAMSFELFREGRPIIVNCGTFAYQCRERNFFRNTSAHNTVMVNETEQSQCWGTFRMAKRSSVRVIAVNDNSITMEMTDYKGQTCERRIVLNEKGLSVVDKSTAKSLKSYIHFAQPNLVKFSVNKGRSSFKRMLYSPEYGQQRLITTVELLCENEICYAIEERDNL